jgi:hypothetical protein
MVGIKLKKQKHLSIRIDPSILRKFHYAAKYEDRSASRQIMYLINTYIREFEERYGEIDVSEEDDDK